MATTTSKARAVPKGSKVATEPLNIESTRRSITDLREQTLMTVAYLEKAHEAAVRGDSATFEEVFGCALESAKSARERARAIDEAVHSKRRAGRA